MFIFTKTRKRTIRLLYTTALSLFLTANASAQNWIPVGATPGGISPSWGSFQNLVGDQSGNVYCSFYDGSVTKGSVMKYDGSAWSYLGGAGITPGSATYSSLTLAGNGDLFYSHQLGWPASGISVQKHDGTSWITLPSAESATVNFQSITSNSSNQPVVAYSSGGNLKVKSFDGTNWTNLGTGLPAGLPNYIDAKCVNDTVYVGFVNSGMKVYKIAASASATDSWIEVGTTSFGATGSEQFRSAIAVDNNNDVFIAFTSPAAGGNKLNVKKYDHATSQWSDVGAANFTDYRVHYVDIALDNNHTPYVAFSNFENAPNNRNFVMKFDGTDWITIGNTDVSGAEAKWNSLVISNNIPILAYSDEPNDAVMVKTFTLSVATLDSVVVSTENNVPAVITTLNGTLQMEAAVYDLSMSQAVNWSITNGTGDAVISATGLVTAQGNGTVYAKAIAVADPTKTDSLMITISGQNSCVPVSSFYENFDAPTLTCCNMGVVPECWNSISTATGANQIISNSTPASGTNNIYQFGYGAGKISIVVMREVNNIHAGTHQFRFKLRANSGPGDLDFGYITDITDASTFVTIQTINVTNSSYNDPIAERIFTVPTTVPSNARLAIRNPGTSWAGFYWDDAYWEPIPLPVGQSIDVTTQNNVAATITSNGGTLQTVAAILPAAANQDVTWSIVNGTGTATISATGLVTAQSNGTVWAKAISVANPTLKDSIEITISGQIVSILSLDVQTQNNISPLIFSANGTLQVIAVITPANTSNPDVTWSIVNGTGAAAISASGLVTAQANGTVWAKAVSVENTTVKDSLLITISGQSSAEISEQQQFSVNFYPNPVEKVLTIVATLPEGTVFPVQLVDANGKVVYSEVLKNTKSQLDLSTLPGGTYRLIVNNTYNQQLIIQ